MATVIERMTGIRVKSDFFNPCIDMTLFPANSKKARRNRVALLYGKNGSGKSTIAQGFREFCTHTVAPELHTVELVPLVDETEITTSDTTDDKGKFFVYDEKYVEEKIKIKDNGLDSIVLFGEQIEREQQIEALTTEIERLTKQVNALEKEYEKYKDSSNIIAPSYWVSQISSILRKKDGWAETDSKIKGNKTKSAVNESIIDRIGNIIPTGTEDEIKEKFEKQYAMFANTSATTEHIKQAELPVMPDNIEVDSQSLLSQVVQKPSLTQRESEILSLFNIGEITAAQTFLADDSNKICPKCLQTINDNYRTETLKQIAKILNRDVEEFQDKLKKLLQSKIDDTDYQYYKVLDSKTYEMIKKAIFTYNTAIDAHNNVVQQKISNPFEPLNYDINSIGLSNAYKTLTSAIKKLNSEIETYNYTIHKRKEIKEILLELNDMLAHYSISLQYKQLVAQRKAMDKVEKLLKLIKDKKSEKEREKIYLDSKRNNIQKAVEEINQSLEYIFFSKNRLSLELGSDQLYHLKVNGHPVEPSKISCGERNALALCYFFTDISRNTDAATVYSDEVFLVIDDPISSFDIENRIGILSFLRWKLEQVHKGCKTSKILIMTHDVSVIYDLSKALEEISDQYNSKSKDAVPFIYHLNNKSIVPFDCKKFNDYTQLLCMVYEYATNTSDNDSDNDLDLIIGNVMRRVFEAFTSFFYKKGIADISRDSQVLDTIPDKASKNYFQYLMYRLVLNGESHFLEQTKCAPETFFFSHISREEKRRTAKDILCFMYLLNRIHVLKHLSSFADAETKLQNWCSNISNY